MNSNPGSRSNSRSTVDSISGEESDTSNAVVALVSSTTSRMQKQEGPQGADLIKDMYKILDGSALVALGKHSLVS